MNRERFERNGRENRKRDVKLYVTRPKRRVKKIGRDVRVDYPDDLSTMVHG